MGCGASKAAQASQPSDNKPEADALVISKAQEPDTQPSAVPQSSCHFSASALHSQHSDDQPSASRPATQSPQPSSPSDCQATTDAKKSGASTPVAESGSPRADADLPKAEFLSTGQAKETESGVISLEEGAATNSQGLRYLAIKHPKMQELHLSGTQLDHSCLEATCDLVSRKKLSKLTLARVGLNNEGAKTLGLMLMTEESSHLKQLGLDGNEQITDEGVKHLADALYTNKSVEELSLWGAGLGDEGATAVAHALKSNTTLKQLWLGECENLTDRGGKELKDALMVNKTLQQLGLVCTMVSDELQNEIEDLVQSDRSGILPFASPA